MIYTVTLNPALDRALWIDKIRVGDANRIKKERRYAGGKGIDVSKVLTTLGAANKAFGFVGGFTGEELESLLINEGIACDFVKITSETRINIIINEASTGNQILLNDKGPRIKSYELMQLIHKMEAAAPPDILTVSGSLPPGVHPVVYRKIVEMAKDRGARVLLDTDGEALKVGVQGMPDLIKPNVNELSRLVNKKLETVDEIIDAAQCVHQQGIRTVLVSMGASGILMVGERGRYLASPPEVEVIDTIGAGDAAVAGFVYGLSTGESEKDALACAVAAGTATTMRPGTALCRKEDFRKLLPRIRMEVPRGR